MGLEPKSAFLEADTFTTRPPWCSLPHIDHLTGLAVRFGPSVYVCVSMCVHACVFCQSVCACVRALAHVCVGVRYCQNGHLNWAFFEPPHQKVCAPSGATQRFCPTSSHGHIHGASLGHSGESLGHSGPAQRFCPTSSHGHIHGASGPQWGIFGPQWAGPGVLSYIKSSWTYTWGVFGPPHQMAGVMGSVL